MPLNQKNKQAESFQKEKLNQQALDNFMLKHAADRGSILYSLKSGEKFVFQAP